MKLVDTICRDDTNHVIVYALLLDNHACVSGRLLVRCFVRLLVRCFDAQQPSEEGLGISTYTPKLTILASCIVALVKTN